LFDERLVFVMKENERREKSAAKYLLFFSSFFFLFLSHLFNLSTFLTTTTQKNKRF